MKMAVPFAQLHAALAPLLPFTPTEWNEFASAFVYRQVPKKFVLTAPGSIAKEAYFINKGAARLYFVKDGEEINANFMFENAFIASLESFLMQTPSRQAVETLEESELLVLSKTRLNGLLASNLKFQLFLKVIAEQAFIMLQRRASSFILDTAEERYTDMINNRPQIAERVPQHMIASYLGVTPVSLSRIRKRISG